MARIRFLTDEHVPKAVARGLRERGVDVTTAAEAGTLGAEDLWLLEHLKAEGRVVITHDADYLRLHAAGVQHAGIVYAPPGMSIGDMIRGALLIAEVLDSEAMMNHVEFL
jgi:phosphoribosylformylglycinamidine (FGAM) synthase-like amidotransferase family enzyme